MFLIFKFAIYMLSLTKNKDLHKLQLCTGLTWGRIPAGSHVMATANLVQLLSLLLYILSTNNHDLCV